MNKKEVRQFFKKLSKENRLSKLTTEKLKKIIEESNFPQNSKSYLCERVNWHSNCEDHNFKKKAFAITKYKKVKSLECTNCNSVVMFSDVLERVI